MIYKHQFELYKKVNKRISEDRFHEIAEHWAEYGARKKIAFSGYYYDTNRNIALLKEYWSNGYISFIDYLSSVFYQNVISKIKLIGQVLFKKYYFLSRIKETRFHSKTLTITDGIERIFPGHINIQIEDIPVEKVNTQIKFFKRLSILFLCIYYNVYHFQSVLQYTILRNDFKNIDFTNKQIIIEEGRSSSQILLMDFAKENNIPLTIYFRGIATFRRYYYGFKLVVTNIISYDLWSTYNKDVSIIKPYAIEFDKIELKKSKKYITGLLVDIGRAGINMNDKKKFDLFFNKISEDNKIIFNVSIHELDTGMKNGYYQSTFTSKYIKYRKETAFEDYLNGIDILVGRVSTAIYQAFLAKVPVILVVLFNEKPMKRLVELSEGLIKYVADERSFLDCYHDFISMKKSEIDLKHKKALKNLQIKL